MNEIHKRIIGALLELGPTHDIPEIYDVAGFKDAFINPREYVSQSEFWFHLKNTPHVTRGANGYKVSAVGAAAYRKSLLK